LTALAESVDPVDVRHPARPTHLVPTAESAGDPSRAAGRVDDEISVVRRAVDDDARGPSVALDDRVHVAGAQLEPRGVASRGPQRAFERLARGAVAPRGVRLVPQVGPPRLRAQRPPPA